MDTPFQSSLIDRTTEKRSRLSWGRRAIPLKHSTFFNKAKHSEEWHHSIDATAGVLHPSDSKFPFDSLRSHTNAYLNKKNKITQADADIRLAILVSAHDARDIGVAAAAYAMSATRLRALLPADLNVMHGSYFGLKMWLQCLIAANYGNPASVTDLEAQWARKLLPFASQGPRAAEWYLVGICRALREVSIPNMDVLPEFAVLMRRALVDFSTQLEGYRLRCQWAEAYDAVLWMIELAETSPATTPPGHLLPEHILDSQLPSWRLWAYWKPNTERLKLLASCKTENLAIVPELVSLEGPDMITGTEATLREGLVAQYGGAKALLRWKGIMIEVPKGTKEGLRAILKRAARALDTVVAAPDPGSHSMFELFKDLVVARPITAVNLDVLDATFRIRYTSSNDVYNAVREVYNNKDHLGGQHIEALQCLLRCFDDDNSDQLRTIFLQGWLRQGIENCARECQKAVRTHIDHGLSWTKLALEYHNFCTTLKASERHWPLAYQTVRVHSRWPSLEETYTVLEIYEAIQMQRTKTVQGAYPQAVKRDMTGETMLQMRRASTSTYQAGGSKSRHPLEEHIEAYCIDRLFEGASIGYASQRTMTAILHVWESTSKPQADVERRELALLVSNSIPTDFDLRCRCLSEIASGKHMKTPVTFVKDLSNILHQSESESSKAIVALTHLLVERKAFTQCWKDLLYAWLEQQSEPRHGKDLNVLEYSLQTMKVAEWFSFMKNIETLFADRAHNYSETRPVPQILQPDLLIQVEQLSRFSSSLIRLETFMGDDCDSVRCLLSCNLRLDNVLTILESLKTAETKPVEALMQRLVGKLSAQGDNCDKIEACLINLAFATPGTVESCIKLYDANLGYLDLPGPAKPVQVADKAVSPRNAIGEALVACTAASLKIVQPAQHSTKLSPIALTVDRRKVPSAVVEIMVTGWIFNDDIDEQERMTIVSVAILLGIDVEVYSTDMWDSKLAEATKFWQGIEDEILQEATRLESLQKALKKKDPRGTRALLQELGIPSNSLLDDEILDLPAGIIDVVERIDEDQVEIGFPLNTLTELQRGAMGIPQGANSLLLRLSIYSIDDASPSFCLHFNNDKNLVTLKHNPWRCSQDSRAPHRDFCTTPQTAFVWQLNLFLHTQLRSGTVGIGTLHQLVKKKIGEMGHACISCGVSHNAKNVQLRRATPCNILSCARLWYQLPLDVRIPEIRTDTFAVDAMLTAVHAAAMSGRAELLPSCPIPGTEAVKAVLNTLPSLTVLSRVTDISAELRRCHLDAEKLISWACIHHRGYIASATGLCKIPTMPPGTHQFVLANASPRLENEFVSKLPRTNPKTTVLFHGTTFDRLPAILAQGLKICSGTALQRTGAAHGKGIYMAEEPATSLTYAPATTSWRSSGLTNMRLLLGCEVAGNGRNVSTGIHVLTDETSVMVRYIFFLTSNSTTPIRNHIVPAMASGMSALRTGAV